MQLLQHYGVTITTVTLSRPISSITIHLKPRPVDGSNPVVGMLLERISGGRYARVPLLDGLELKDETPISRDASIEPGTYRVTVQFFKSSGAGRSHLEVHSVTFE